MDNLITYFNTYELEIKLTSEKIFINTITSNETFALHSVNGIGVVVLIKEYNKALILWKSQNNNILVFYVFGGLFVLIGSFSFFASVVVPFFLFIVSAIFFTIGVYLKKENEPILMSAVRIMMSGGNRDFQFDNSGIKSENVAEFVAKVESTLSAYHKNND